MKIDTDRKFNELPEETQAFLSQLSDDDILMLKDGLRLVAALRLVGSFIKWLILGVMGIVLGTVMFWEAFMKILNC